METFALRKEEILTRARKASACSGEYRKAYAANDDTELLTVVKENFAWCQVYKVIDLPLLQSFSQADLVAAGIFITGNHSVNGGSVRADGNATVEAYGNATVEAYGNATVEAYGNATVRAYGNATVRADGNATVEAYGNATVEAYGNANLFIYNQKSATLNGFSIARYASYWGAAPTRIELAKSAHERLIVNLETAAPVANDTAA